LPKNEATANTIRAFISMAHAVHRAWPLVTDVALPRAARLASGKVPMPFAVRLAGLPVPLSAAGARVGASVPPLHSLNLAPGPYDAGFQIHI
jgi:hypothetical protein